MGATELMNYHQQATRRWPRVCWDAESYAQHVGDAEPPHPLDLYLAGAAGHRLEAAWEAIEMDDGAFVRAMLIRQALADFTPEDLWQETVTRQMDEDAASPMLPTGKRLARIIKYRGLVELRTYLIVCARRSAQDRYRQLRASRPPMTLTGPDGVEASIAAPVTEGPLKRLEDEEATANMRCGLQKGWSGLSPEEQFLLAMVFHTKMQQKDAGALLGWSPFKTNRTLRKALESLRTTIANEGIDWNPSLSAAWAGLLEKLLSAVQVSAARPSS